MISRLHALVPLRFPVRPVLLACLLCVEAPATASPSSAQIVMVGHVPRDRGSLKCGLFDREGWLKRPLQSAQAVPAGLRGVCQFQPLAPGSYAWGAYLDENDNGRLDFDLTGYPREPYGVSNGVRAHLLLPPSFDAAKIDYPGGELTVQLQLE